MIKSIVLIYNSIRKNVDFDSKQINKTVVDCSEIVTNKYNSFDIEIEFLSPIIAFRNHDYTWVDCGEARLANEFTPKVLKFENGSFVQANINQGIWEFNKKFPNKILWKFNPEFSKPITEYNGANNQKRIYQATTTSVFVENPTLLFSNICALELSRSKIPFSAIACFTDHCDFDTLENLQLQRQFFKENNIKITKGFFLNHFSKRNDNASFENDKNEIDLWENDGHELCYHSLSQSIKSLEESFDDFKTFVPPYKDLKVWIDHGFQPYNFSFYKKNGLTSQEFEATMSQKNIDILWNYVDSGTSTKGIYNQLNTSQFTLKNYKIGIKNFPLKSKLVMMFKSIVFHYDNNEKRVRNYIDSFTHLKLVVKKYKISSIIAFFKNIIPLIYPILKVMFFWNTEKNRPFKVAKYAPLLFKHKIEEKEFYIFQTLEMVNFKKALANENVNSLINESGIFIAHTYFSVDLKHYSGKLFKTNGVFDEDVVSNFNYLGSKIKENKIWNPSLSELVNYFSEYDATIFDSDENGVIILKNNAHLVSKNIS